MQSAARVHSSSSVPGGYARGVPVPGYVQYASKLNETQRVTAAAHGS